MKKLFLIDAYALIYRYYYAFMGRPMSNGSGLNTSVIHGFVRFVRDILKRECPDLIGVAFDPRGGSFRNDIFEAYKANRPSTPEDIIASIPYIKRFLEAMCIPILEVDGYEADDVIGTLSWKGVDAGYDVYMVTPDKDYGQLVRPHNSIYKHRGKGEDVEIVDVAAIKEKYGFDDPTLVCDMLAIWGDTSDNIPGVPGIGQKGALRLIGQWGTVENIIAAADKIGGKQGASIAEHSEQLLLSKRLAKICCDVPIEFREEDLTMCEPNYDELRRLFAELKFTAFLNDLHNASPVAELSSAPVQSPQTQLAEVARAKSAERRRAKLEGQGDLFAVAAQVEPIGEGEEQEQPTTDADEAFVAFKTIADVPHVYSTVQSAEELSALVAHLAQSPAVCFDTETTGLDVYSSKIIGISFAVKEFEAWYVPLDDSTRAPYLDIMRPLFGNDKIDKIGQNIKFDLMMLTCAGVAVRGRFIDTMLLHYLLDPESRHSMNYLAQNYLNYEPIPIESLIGRGVRQMTMDMVVPERLAEYAAEDADVTLRLRNVLYPLVEKEGLHDLYFRIEEPMIEVLAAMEIEGVKIDSEALAEYSVELTQTLSALEARVRSLADEPQLNINSSRQLGEVLFGKLRLSDKPKMTKTKQFSTDEEYLQSLSSKHEIIKEVLEYRGVKKLLSTYVNALPLLVNPVSGRLHTSFNQAVTATGRLSSTNPNLQNIPIRDALGRKIRAAFVGSDSEHEILSADYSQVELRLMAHLSGDEHLIEAFDQGEDIHAATAARLFKKPIGEVTSEERRRAKTANFGIIYGISAFGLSQRLDIPRAEAKAIIEGYFESYPKVKEYMERVVKQAAESDFVETIFGRRRYLRDISSRNAVARGVAERNAINAPIQGSAADIMKLAMVGVYRALQREGLRSKMILQVHDEIVIDLVRTERAAVERIVCHEMESAAQLRVRLVAECGVGRSWLDAH